MSPAFVTIYAPVLAVGIAVLLAGSVALYLIKSRLHSKNLRFPVESTGNRWGFRRGGKVFSGERNVS